MKTANLVKVSDRVIYRYYRGLYYRNVNALKYFENVEDFETSNENQLHAIYEIVASMLVRNLITVPDADRLIDITILQQMARANVLTVADTVKEDK